MARPSKLTPKVQAEILRWVRQGVPQQTAALNAGVSIATFYRWKARGRDAKRGVYREFCDALEEAQAQAEANMVLQLRAHGKRDARTIQWMLERRFPERWARRQIIEATGPGGAPLDAPRQVVSVNLRDMTLEQLRALAADDMDDEGLDDDPPELPDPLAG